MFRLKRPPMNLRPKAATARLPLPLGEGMRVREETARFMDTIRGRGLRPGGLSRGLSLLLSLVLVLAPVVPVFAFVAESDDAHAAHTFHDGKADISDHASHKQTPCAQHDSCAGQDRDCCAHCFGLVSLVQAAYLHSHPVQTPVLNQLHPFFPTTSPDRPPRRFSL